MHLNLALALFLIYYTIFIMAQPTKRTSQPIVTGTTVIGLKYQGGVMLAADTLASYGSLARYKDVRRIKKIGLCILLN